MKKYLIVFFSSLIAFLLVMPLRGDYITLLGLGGFPLSLLAGCIILFALTLFFLSKYGDKLSKSKIMFAILVGVILLELPFRIIIFKPALVSLPDSLFKVLAVVVAYGVFKIKNIFCKVAASALFFALCLWFSYYGYCYYINKLNHDTFTGKVELVTTTPLNSIVFQNENNENIDLSDINCTYLVLDFWNSSCGICFMMFPVVQRLYERWNNEQVQVYGIFCQNDVRKETPATGTKLLHEKGYTFPFLSLDSKDPVLNEMGVIGFPTVLIFDKDRTIVFRGSILLAEKFLEKIRPPILPQFMVRPFRKFRPPILSNLWCDHFAN